MSDDLIEEEFPVTERDLRGLLIECRNAMPFPTVLRARIDTALKATMPQPNPPAQED